MLYKSINLKEKYKKLERDATLDIMCPSNNFEVDLNRKRPGILILPGGGYDFVSLREGEPVGLRFLGYDFNVFVLSKYSINPNTIFPYPLIEGLAAIDYIRKNSKEFNLDENKLYVMGFSAGGHFAASIAAHYKDPQFAEYLGVNDADFTVNGCVLGYPVITTDSSFTHQGTANNVCKANPQKLKDYFAIEKNVTKDFPRTFIFSFEEDPAVPIKNTYVLVDALKKVGVEVECHIYHGEYHGTSLGDRSVYNDNFDVTPLKESTNWPLLAIDFIRR